jgi:holo-[acyl-carrier protein] synthase
MDILGLGSEIVECLRIGRMIERHGERFLHRVYTEREIRDCQARKRNLEHFAARWAAKEAVLKALGVAWTRDLPYTEIEVQTSPAGVPQVTLHGTTRDVAQAQGVSGVLLTFAHCRAYATAYAVAVRGG